MNKDSIKLIISSIFLILCLSLAYLIPLYYMIFETLSYCIMVIVAYYMGRLWPDVVRIYEKRMSTYWKKFIAHCAFLIICIFIGIFIPLDWLSPSIIMFFIIIVISYYMVKLFDELIEMMKKNTIIDDEFLIKKEYKKHSSKKNLLLCFLGKHFLENHHYQYISGKFLKDCFPRRCKYCGEILVPDKWEPVNSLNEKSKCKHKTIGYDNKENKCVNSIFQECRFCGVKLKPKTWKSIKF